MQSIFGTLSNIYDVVVLQKIDLIETYTPAQVLFHDLFLTFNNRYFVEREKTSSSGYANTINEIIYSWFIKCKL